MKPVVQKLLYAAFIVGTLAVVLLLALRSGDLASSMEAIRSMPVRYLLAGAALTFFAIFCETLSALSAMRMMGHHIAVLDMFRISILGDFYGYVTPGATGGQPVVIYQMYKRKVPVGDATSIQLMHHLFFQLALNIVATVLAIAHWPFIREQVGPNMAILVFGYCFNFIVLVLLLLLCLTRRPVRWTLEKLTLLAEKLHLKKLAALRETILKTADQFYVASHTISNNPAEIARQLAFGLMRVVSLNSVMYCVYRGLGLSGHGYGQLLAMSVMLYISAAYTPLPGASGAQEGFFALYFAGMFPNELIFSGMLAWRFITYYLVLAVGVVVMLSMGAHKQGGEVTALEKGKLSGEDAGA